MKIVTDIKLYAEYTLSNNYGGGVSHKTLLNSSEFVTVLSINTPSFSKRKAAGEIVMNPYNKSSAILRSTTGQLNGSYAGMNYSITGGSITLYMISLYGKSVPEFVTERPLVLDTAAMAKQACLANVDKPTYAMSEDLAEIRDTLEFLKHPMTQVSKTVQDYVSAVRKIRGAYAGIKNASELSRLLSSLWLQYRFVFMTSYASVKNLADSLAAQKPLPVRRTARGFQKSSNTISGTKRWYWTGDVYDEFEYSVLLSRESRATLVYEVTNPIDTWRENAGLRLKDVPATLWAVARLSWLFDRFLNLSNALQGLTNLADPGVKILGGTVSTTEKLVITLKFTKEIQPPWTMTVTPDIVTLDLLTKDRQVWWPALVDVVPSLDYPTGFKQSLDEIALIILKLTHSYK